MYARCWAGSAGRAALVDEPRRTPRARVRGLVFVASLTLGMAVMVAPALAVQPASNLQVTPGAKQVAVSWTASPTGTTGTGAVTGYEVFRGGSKPIFTTDAYTTNYLDTSVSPGTAYTYSVVAVSGTSPSTGNPSANTATVSTTSTTTLSSCSSTVYGSGHYVLSGNLTAPAGKPCLQFSAASGGVSLDCQTHTISDGLGQGNNNATDLVLNGVNGFVVANCNFAAPEPFYTWPPYDDLVDVTSSQNGQFTNDTFTAGPQEAWVYSSSTSNVAFNSDVFTNAPVTQTEGSNDYFGNNTASEPGQNTNDLLAMQGNPSQQNPPVLSNNVVDHNQLDGSSDLGGYADHLGADDAIGLDYESGDTLVNNDVGDVYDCGIETGNLISHDLFANNYFDNNWAAGICSYWYTSWLDNTATGNTTFQGGTMFSLNGANSLATGQTENDFYGNTFTSNVSVAAANHEWDNSTFISQWTTATGHNASIPLLVGDNTFNSNNFGSTLSALIDPGVVTSQSGNECIAPLPSGITSCGTPVTPATQPPTTAGVYPSQGPTGGGTSVKIVGTGLLKATKVYFGATQGTITKVLSDSELIATSPAGSGTVNVTVVTSAGTSPVSLGDQFAYGGFPVVTGLSVAGGAGGGGTAVTITGSNFTGATEVDFGAVKATSFTVVSATTINATAPAAMAGAASPVNVIVTTPAGSSAVTGGITPTGPTDPFIYVPAITTVTPSEGAVSGGGTVTISGYALSDATAVDFGSTVEPYCSSSSGPLCFVENGNGTINATIPSGTDTTGAVNLQVVGPGGTSPVNAANGIYIYGPAITGVSPLAGPIAGGTTVTLSGTGFLADGGVDTVIIGGKIVTPTSVSDTAVSFVAPAHAAGAVSIAVITAGEGSSPDSAYVTASQSFEYEAQPQVTSVAPGEGAVAGGTPVTITGSGFTGATAVDFGSTVLGPSQFTINSDTQITTTSPAGTDTSGAVNIQVVSPGGTSPVNAASGIFIYGPVITGVSPTTGSIAGGTTVTLSGTGFLADGGVDTVVIGGKIVTPTSVSDTAVSFVTPAHAAGAVSIAVITLGEGSSPDSAYVQASQQFTYAIAVTGVSPSEGAVAGGTQVTITGSGFTGATAVDFGSSVLGSSQFTVNSDTQITATAPAGTDATGAVNVQVVAPGGTSPVNSGSGYFIYGPVITGVSPTSGGVAGGTTVTLAGTGFLADGAVDNIVIAGHIVAPSSVTETAVTFKTPAATAGTYNVTVYTAGEGSSPESAVVTAPQQFTFH